MEHRILEPVGEVVGAAAFAAFLRRLWLAVLAAGRGRRADVEMVIVTPPRPDLGQPAAVAFGFAAQRLLDGGIDEDALDARLLRGVAQHQDMTGSEDFGGAVGGA